MRRSLLNKRILPKPLRQALVLITLLLLPNAAWGQTEYPLYIAGTQVTSENAANFFNDETKTVSFTPSDGTNPATLTLNNATISREDGAPAISLGETMEKLVIDIKGTNTIQTNDDTAVLAGTKMGSNQEDYSSIEFTSSTGTGSLTLQRGGSTPGVISFGYMDLASLNVSYNGLDPTYLAPEGATSLTTATQVQISVVNFNLTVATVPVTSFNRKDILNNGKVSFTPAEGDDFATLTLNNATLNGGIIWNNGSNDLIVKLDGMNYIETSTNDPAFKATASCDLYIKKNNPDNDATVKFSGYIVDFNSQLDDGFKQIFDAITPCSYYTTKTVYGISIGGTDLHDISGENGYLNTSTGAITGMDHISFALATVSPDAQTPGTPATLTLDGATINGRIEWKNGTNNLRLCLSGKNSIICNKGGEPPVSVFKAENTCTLFVEKVSDAESATLKYASYGTTDGTPSNVTSYFENFILSANTAFNQTAFVIQDGDIKYNYLTTTGTDNLSVAGIQVHGISGELGYRNNILQDEDATVKFDGSQTLTLNNAEIYSFSSTHAIETGLSTLNIDLKGNNSITTEGGYALYGNGGTRTIIFTSSSNPVGNLTLKNYSGTLANYVTIDYDTNTGLVPTIITPSSASDLAAAKEAIIAKGTAMGITVAGVVVTNSNYTDIKGDGITGTKVSFTPANEGNETPAILTLNNASITGNVKFNDDLTVHLVGDNTITKPEDASGSYAFDLGGGYYYLNFSTDKTELGTLKIVGSYSGLQNHGIVYNGQIEGGSATIGTTGDAVIWKQTFSTTGVTPSYFILSLNKHYNLWKNGHQYHDLILDNNDGFVFDPEESTLTISSSSSSDYINSGLENLTIIVNGTQSMSYIAFGAPEDTQAEGITTGTLTITGKEDSESSSSINSLSLSNSGGVITGFSSENITITLPMHVSYTNLDEFTGWTTSVTNAYITDEPDNLEWMFEHGQSYATYCERSKDTYPSSTITPSVITEISGSTVKTQALSYIPKGVPVLLSKTNNTATTATFSKNLLKFAESDNPVTASEGKALYVLYNDQFVKVTPRSEIYYAGYLDLTGVNLPANTRGLTIDGGDEGTTALREVRSEGVKGEKSADGEWYTLQGRKFTTKPTKPGLYILNGRKVVIK